MAIHVVQKGDSLWQIARRYDVTVESLMKANGLQSDLLMPGLALYVPTPTLTTKFYQIKPGDTLWKIAQFFQTTVSTIFDANDGLDIDRLEVGRTIDVPTIEKMEMETLGFFVPYSLADFFEKFPTYSQQLTYLAVVSYSLRADGKLVVLLDDRGIAEACRARGVMPLAMVRDVLENGEFRPELVGQMLKSRAAQERFIEQVIAMLDEKRYEGVSIDFEFIPPDARREYVEFSCVKTAIRRAATPRKRPFENGRELHESDYGRSRLCRDWRRRRYRRGDDDGLRLSGRTAESGSADRLDGASDPVCDRAYRSPQASSRLSALRI